MDYKVDVGKSSPSKVRQHVFIGTSAQLASTTPLRSENMTIFAIFPRSFDSYGLVKKNIFLSYIIQRAECKYIFSCLGTSPQTIRKYYRFFRSKATGVALGLLTNFYYKSVLFYI